MFIWFCLLTVPISDCFTWNFVHTLDRTRGNTTTTGDATGTLFYAHFPNILGASLSVTFQYTQRRRPVTILVAHDGVTIIFLHAVNDAQLNATTTRHWTHSNMVHLPYKRFTLNHTTWFHRIWFCLFTTIFLSDESGVLFNTRDYSCLKTTTTSSAAWCPFTGFPHIAFRARVFVAHTRANRSHCATIAIRGDCSIIFPDAWNIALLLTSSACLWTFIPWSNYPNKTKGKGI